MMLFQILWLSALFATVGLSLTHGGRDERLAALAIVLASLATPLMVHQGYVGTEAGILLIDALLLMVLGWIALTSRAWWPIWAAGFQLGALVVHFTAGRVAHILPAAYADTLAIWSYAVVGALAAGAWWESRPQRLA